MMEMFPYPIRYFACRNYDEQQKQRSLINSKYRLVL